MLYASAYKAILVALQTAALNAQLALIVNWIKLVLTRNVQTHAQEHAAETHTVLLLTTTLYARAFPAILEIHSHIANLYVSTNYAQKIIKVYS